MAARRKQLEEDIEDEVDDEIEERETRPTPLWWNDDFRRWGMIPLILVLFFGAIYFMWRQYGDHVEVHPSYLLSPDSIQITPPPEWLRRDVLGETMRLASLEKASIHEPGLSVKIASAFESHPWVKSVERVVPRYPAAIQVQLNYRSPCAMVLLPDDDPDDDAAWMLPIDSESTLLPFADFNEEEARNFPRIHLGNIPSPPQAGVPWGDPGLAAAAKLAELLYTDWQVLSGTLYQIELCQQPTSTTQAPDFDILGRPNLANSLLIHWGRAPGRELAGEPTAAAKIDRLKTWISESKTAGHPLEGTLDLRSTRGVR